MSTLDGDLDAALIRFAQFPTVVVATDYDGVVAPIVSDPAEAFPLPGTVDALVGLSTASGVTVALISGRDRATLGRLSGVDQLDGFITVGSHGAEWDDGLEGALDAAAQALRTQVLDALTTLAREYPGAAVESKPLGGALHVRNVEAGADSARRALADARTGPASWPGVHATEGKAVLELTVAEASKGRALSTLRERTGAAAVLYLGDDVTDEKAFAVLTGRDDVSIKVGEGDTAARFRVADPAAARAVFERILQLRR